MEIIYGLENISPSTSKAFLTIGIFDGVHLGHQKILSSLSKKAREDKAISLVLTFSEHPDKLLHKKSILLIQTLNQRLETISKFGIDKTIVIDFKKEIYSLKAEEFIEKILVNKLNVDEIFVGENFRFGKDRAGNINILREMSKSFGFKVNSFPLIEKNGKKVSSSIIRDLLLRGEIEEANLFLGRNYCIEGEVIKGHSRGKKLGVPTANLTTDNEILPHGVYITSTKFENKFYPSVTNIGFCPTFEQKSLNVEVHLFDFSENIYGKKLKIYFFKKIRNEIKFNNPAHLLEQIHSDFRIAKDFFSQKSYIINQD
ncbi:bifunctional riboflavin kinase/FAD synthetase [Candidatus Aminicenantes bacterium AC-335-A11]|jgi:riboflavin kinase/FMN adenylyltransferase|nr:bifunctional riboflavin kinase/FAD synthetase [SCandidatus Aminicenantes bacterium Aminicenantia_JdfR_composite]MCP2617931.1 bifunctional riboflavin kinase/FAD synthetase [Candidatus Aminicenantes bacterium AC-335-A11]